jgi:hypothetical protein
VKIGARKAVLFVQAEIIYNSHACTFKPYDILKVKNAQVKSVHYIMDDIDFSSVLSEEASGQFVCLSQLTADRSVG